VPNPLDELFEPYRQVVLGRDALHVPLNAIVRYVDGKTVWMVAQSRIRTGERHPLHFNDTQSRDILVMGDAFIRPRIALASTHLWGDGASGMATDGFDVDRWSKHGEIVFATHEAQADLVVDGLKGERK
jgi:hypothetical protein